MRRLYAIVIFILALIAVAFAGMAETGIFTGTNPMKKIDDNVNLDELEDGLHKVAEGGGTEGLHHFRDMVRSQELKLQKQYEMARRQAEKNGTSSQKEINAEDAKVHESMDKLIEVEHEAEEALDELEHPDLHQCDTDPTKCETHIKRAHTYRR